MASEAIPNWHRVAGAFANQSPARGACEATVGTLAHTCSSCGNKYVVIAAIADAATEWVHPLLRFGPDDDEDPGVNDVAAHPELEAAE